MTTTCDRCGTMLQVGDYPFCPHGRATAAVIGDDVPGGFTVENGFRTPQTFYSKRAHQQALAANGMEMAPRWVPNDKHLLNWAAGIDAKTLDNARVLLSRGRAARPSLPPIDARVEWE